MNTAKAFMQCLHVRLAPALAHTPQGPVLRQIAREEGWAALWRGITPRILFNVPSAAVCWGIYETGKRLMAP